MRTAVLVFLLVGCGGPPVSATPLMPSGENQWADRSFAQRHETMTFAVLPVLSRRFAAHRGSENAELACITCHGRDAEEVEYRMPNGLPPLDPDAIPQSAEARWMAVVVTPTVDRLMSAGGTTTCFTCHPRAER